MVSQVAIKDLEPIKVRYTSRRSQLESAPRRSRNLGLGPFMIHLNKREREIQKIQRFQKRTLDTKVCMFLLLLGTFLLPYVSLLQPLGDAMMAVKWEMCGGNQTFVVGESLGRCLCV